MFFRIKKGSEIRGNALTGGGREFSANDPKNNIIESDTNLAAEEPEKYEVFTGHLTDEQRANAQFSNAPTQDVDTENLTPDELEAESQRMIERAAALKKQAAVKRQQEETEAEEMKATPASKGKPMTQEKQAKTTPATKATATPTNEKEYHAQVDKLSISDLRTHAKERGVDLSGLTTREEMASKIKSHKDE